MEEGEVDGGEGAGEGTGRGGGAEEEVSPRVGTEGVGTVGVTKGGEARRGEPVPTTSSCPSSPTCSLSSTRHLAASV